MPTVCCYCSPPKRLHSPALLSHIHPHNARWHGKDRVKFLETLVVGGVAGLGVGEARLSLLTTEAGGIIDDTIITNAGDYTYVRVKQRLPLRLRLSLVWSGLVCVG